MLPNFIKINFKKDQHLATFNLQKRICKKKHQYDR